MRGYKVSPLSKADILRAAEKVREIFGIIDWEKIDIIRFLEIMHANDIVHFECCDDNEALHKGEGFYDPATKTIIIPDSVYLAACDGDGRARFTAAHEFAHFSLEHKASLSRKANTTWEKYEDSEWQADTFTGYFLAPPRLALKYETPGDVAKAFGLSNQAAEIALKNAQKEKPRLAKRS